MFNGFLADSSVKELLGKARPLSVEQLLDEADIIYRCHWAVVEADHHGQEPPGNLYPDVVYERHYALNWLLRFMNQEWDDVSTDT